MIFDTDVLIWAQRGNVQAAHLIETTDSLQISVFTYMELLQGAPKKAHHKIIKKFLNDFNVMVLPITETIGHRASIYVEEYGLSNGIRAGDALIAATAVEHNSDLITSNTKHYKMIKELNLVSFKP
jgi:predicted nucleic acid-binding protein